MLPCKGNVQAAFLNCADHHLMKFRLIPPTSFGPWQTCETMVLLGIAIINMPSTLESLVNYTENLKEQQLCFARLQIRLSEIIKKNGDVIINLNFVLIFENLIVVVYVVAR